MVEPRIAQPKVVQKKMNVMAAIRLNMQTRICEVLFIVKYFFKSRLARQKRTPKAIPAPAKRSVSCCSSQSSPGLEEPVANAWVIVNVGGTGAFPQMAVKPCPE